MNTSIITRFKKYLLLALATLCFTAPHLRAQDTKPSEPNKNLAVLWTSGDPEVAHRVALLYTLNAKTQNWFDQVQLTIWGPSQHLVVSDKSIHEYLKKIQEAGVVVEACVNCAEAYGIVDDLKALGIEVKPMGIPLTEFLQKPDWEVLSF